MLIVTGSQRLLRRAIIPTSENGCDAGTPLPLIASTEQLQLQLNVWTHSKRQLLAI